MSWLEPGALAWLGLVPVLLVLYFMKLKRKEALVPAVFLWRRAAREARVDSFFQKLKLNLLLLLQLLALIGLTLALARPYLLSPGSVADKLVLVLDTSASMQARLGESTRFDSARSEALRLAREAPRGAEIMVVAAGRQTRVVLPFTSDRSKAVAQLGQLEPEDTQGDLSGLRSLVASIAGSHPRAEVFLLGDELPSGPLHPRLRFLGFGEAADNVAVTAFHLTPTPTRRGLLVFAALQSYSAQVQNLTARFYRGGRELRVRRLVLPAGSRRTVIFPAEPEGPADFEVRLDPEDALAVDNRAFALAPRARPLRVVLRGEAPRFLEKALLSIPDVRVFRHDEPSERYDVEVCSGPAPRAAAPLRLELSPPEGKALEGAFPLTPGRSALADGVPLHNLWVRRVAPLVPPPGAEVVLLAGEHPALVLARSPEQVQAVFGFDLYDSNLPLSPGFPILMARLVREQARDGNLPSQIPAGQPLEVKARSVRLPDGQTRELSDEVFLETGRVGFYEVPTGDSVEKVAVNLFSERESRLEDAPPSQEGAPESEAPVRREALAREYWREMTLAVLVVLLAEWFLYHRRRA